MKKLVAALSLPALMVAFLPAGAHAQVPSGDPQDLPVLSAEVPRGRATLVPSEGPAPVAKAIDGNVSDWVGVPSRYGGTAVYSAGELVYQDHLFDAHGADDGRDATRFEQTDQLEELEPGFYRLDALAQADAAGELGVPAPEQYSYGESYGDATSHQDAADLLELRVATDATNIYVVGRTTTMTDATSTGLLLLADTNKDSALGEVPFNSGLVTDTADVAVLLAGGRGLVATNQGITELTKQLGPPAARLRLVGGGASEQLTSAVGRQLDARGGAPRMLEHVADRFMQHSVEEVPAGALDLS